MTKLEYEQFMLSIEDCPSDKLEECSNSEAIIDLLKNIIFSSSPTILKIR